MSGAAAGAEVPLRSMSIRNRWRTNSKGAPEWRRTGRPRRRPGCGASVLAACLVAALVDTPMHAADPTATGIDLAADRLVARRADRLVRDLASRAERATLRGRPETPASLKAWLVPRLEEIGANPASIAPRALARQSSRAEADAVIRLALSELSDRPPAIDPAEVPQVLRSRPDYPANPAAAADLLRRLGNAPAIATLSTRRAPSVAERLLELEEARAAIEPARAACERLREWIRAGLAAIPGELGAAALVLADLEELAALAHRGWPTAKAKRRLAESIDEVAAFASPPTIEFLLTAFDAMPDIPNRCVHRVERRGDGGLRIEFARCSIGEADRNRWRQRLSGKPAKRGRPRITPTRESRPAPTRKPASWRAARPRTAASRSRRAASRRARRRSAARSPRRSRRLRGRTMDPPRCGP